MSFTIKYAPQTLDEIVLDPSVRTRLNHYVNGNRKTPLILHGTNGLGKTSIASLLPCAMENQAVSPINMLTDQFDTVADVVKFFENRYFYSYQALCQQERDYFVLNEVDFNTKVSKEFRKQIDKYVNYAQFIFTTNDYWNMDIGLRSRCYDIELKPVTAQDWIPRIEYILQAEQVTISSATVLNIISTQLQQLPDYRKLLDVIEDIVLNVKSQSNSASAPIAIVPTKANAITTQSTHASITITPISNCLITAPSLTTVPVTLQAPTSTK